MLLNWYTTLLAVEKVKKPNFSPNFKGGITFVRTSCFIRWVPPFQGPANVAQQAFEALRLVGHRVVARLLEPDQLLFRCLDQIEIILHQRRRSVLVQHAVKDKIRHLEFCTGAGKVRCSHGGPHGCKHIAVPFGHADQVRNAVFAGAQHGDHHGTEIAAFLFALGIAAVFHHHPALGHHPVEAALINTHDRGPPALRRRWIFRPRPFGLIQRN